MTIHNVVVFNREGECIYQQEWHRPRKATMSQSEEMKLLYGMLFSIKSFVSKMAPTEKSNQFLSYQTNKYRLNFFESASGIKFVLNTDILAIGVQELLRNIYSQAYVEYVVKNPTFTVGAPIVSPMFEQRLHELVSAHSSFDRPTGR